MPLRTLVVTILLSSGENDIDPKLSAAINCSIECCLCLDAAAAGSAKTSRAAASKPGRNGFKACLLLQANADRTDSQIHGHAPQIRATDQVVGAVGVRKQFRRRELAIEDVVDHELGAQVIVEAQRHRDRKS